MVEMSFMKTTALENVVDLFRFNFEDKELKRRFLLENRSGFDRSFGCSGPVRFLVWTSASRLAYDKNNEDEEVKEIYRYL